MGSFFLKKTLGLFLIYLLLISCSGGKAEKSIINVWHQMHYENRKVLREVCDEYEKQNPGVRINLTYRETEELRHHGHYSTIGYIV